MTRLATSRSAEMYTSLPCTKLHQDETAAHAHYDLCQREEINAAGPHLLPIANAVGVMQLTKSSAFAAGRHCIVPVPPR